ncbi:hypothetical protein AB9K34_11410 [Sedimentitalea sp. XS_ASV28]|uniref:hypothetical protein n=1 Tax=Sedimentitalea sp. XS_ASV28 TaxID=3241296 RepID=UPI0035155B45
MTHKSTFLFMLAGFALALPQAGEAFTSKLGARVNPVNSSVFEVVPKSSGDGQVFWCSAADYAQRELRAPWQARIYIARGRAPSMTTGRRSSVQFTLDPQAAGITPAPSSISLNSLKVGESMTVQQAYGYCSISPFF